MELAATIDSSPGTAGRRHSDHTLVDEGVYTLDHPDVIEWTKIFTERANAAAIIGRFQSLVPERGLDKARIVAVEWYRFSNFLPGFLCRAASMMSDNMKRHYAIQIVYEELGSRKSSDIHAVLFLNAFRGTDIATDAFDEEKSSPLVLLERALTTHDSDAGILGVLLGLEIPAEQNIENVFSSLTYDDRSAIALGQSKFFVLHRAIEIEHTRLTVSNFLRFCPDDASKERFMRGFDAAIDFWKRYWEHVADAIRRG